MEADADPARRHAVRLVEVIDSDAASKPLVDPLTGSKIVEVIWHSEDALPFPLCLSALVNDANGKPIVREVSVARGNVALADHGLTLPAVTLPTPRNRTIYRPELRITDLRSRKPMRP
jgi:hypothetical protein